VPEDGEFSESDIDKYVFGVRVYEDRFEWLLNLSPEARGELDDASSPVYFKKITVIPDDERAWFRMHPQWSKSNKYAELEAWIYIQTKETGRKGCGAAFPSCPALCGYNSVFISFASVGRHFPKSIALQSEKPSR